MTIEASYDKSKKKVWTGEVRLSFPFLFETARDPKGEDTGKYTVKLLIPKTDKKTFECLLAGINDVIAEVWGANKPKGLNLPIADGDAIFEEKGREETKGMWVVNAWSRDKPGILDRKAKIVVTKERREELSRKADSNPENAKEFEKYSELTDQDIYSGCWARVSLKAKEWGVKFKTPGGVGVRFELHNLQKTKDDETFSGKVSASADFQGLDAEEEQSYAGSDDDKLRALMG